MNLLGELIILTLLITDARIFTKIDTPTKFLQELCLNILLIIHTFVVKVNVLINRSKPVFCVNPIQILGYIKNSPIAAMTANSQIILVLNHEQ